MSQLFPYKNVEIIRMNIIVMALFTQIVILMLVLACMVMVLLAIRKLTHSEGFEDVEETEHLRDELEDEGKILSHNNIFSTLVDSDTESYWKERDHKKNSKEPVSRKE